MKKLQILWVGLVVLTLLSLPFEADADDSTENKIAISEVQTGTDQSASNEFIEIYNRSDELIELKNYEIEYKSSTGKSWFQKIEFSDEDKIQPRGFYLISSYELEERIDKLETLRLAGSGGHLRIVNIESSKVEPVDTLGWGSADSPESNSAEAPDKSQSISRVFDKYGKIIDTDDNSADFEVFKVPRPESSKPLEENTSEESNSTDSEEYKPVEITELLIDPKSPLTDKQDEYVELYNQHSVEVNLSGYELKTGSELRYSHEFSNTILQPHTYYVFKSEETGLTLANNNGKAALFSPNDEILTQTEFYEDTKTGKTWAKFEDEWAWAEKTPQKENIKLSEEDKNDNDQQEAGDERDEENREYFSLEITELFIDPVKPQTDARNEFIEIYNPNDFDVSLEGYRLKSGLPLRYQHTFDSGTIKSKEYRVFYAEETSLTLANNDGLAALFGDDEELFRTAPYESAPPAASWALIEDSWQYTYQPTPGKANELLKKDSALASTEINGGVGSQATNNEEVVSSLNQPTRLSSSGTSKAIVVGLTVVAILYTIYEFRFDIRNRVELTRRYLESRREDRLGT